MDQFLSCLIHKGRKTVNIGNVCYNRNKVSQCLQKINFVVQFHWYNWYNSTGTSNSTPAVFLQVVVGEQNLWENMLLLTGF